MVSSLGSALTIGSISGGGIRGSSIGSSLIRTVCEATSVSIVDSWWFSTTLTRAELLNALLVGTSRAFGVAIDAEIDDSLDIRLSGGEVAALKGRVVKPSEGLTIGLKVFGTYREEDVDDSLEVRG